MVVMGSDVFYKCVSPYPAVMVSSSKLWFQGALVVLGGFRIGELYVMGLIPLVPQILVRHPKL
eukprot:15337002-Ditylum_brightwellii.AAC.1